MTDEEIKKLESSLRTRNDQDMDQPYGQGKLLSLQEAEQEPGYKIIDTTHFSKEQSRYAVVIAQLLHLGTKPEVEDIIPPTDQSIQQKLL